MAKRTSKDGIRRHGKGWQLTLRLKGQPTHYSTWPTRQEAEDARAELLLNARRARLGLEVRTKATTLREAVEGQYLPARRRVLADPVTEEGRWKRILAALGDKHLHVLNGADVDTFLARELEGGASPQTVRHLRNALHAFYRWAIEKKRLLGGPNPVKAADRVDVPRPEPKSLTLEQVRRALQASHTLGWPTWALAVHLGFYAAMRRGEVFGLRWEAVDFERGLVWVVASWEGEDKTRVGEPVPIHRELLPLLREAHARRSGPWVCPARDGSMLTEDFDAAGWMRRTLAAAGLKGAWLHTCRTPPGAANPGARNGRAKLTEQQVAELHALKTKRLSNAEVGRLLGVSRTTVQNIVSGKRWAATPAPRRVGCGHEEKSEGGGLMACPKCGNPMHARQLPLDFTFKHLRSSMLTLLAEAEGDTWAAQRMGRHAGDGRTTRRHYLARRLEPVQAALDSLSVQPAPAVLGAGEAAGMKGTTAATVVPLLDPTKQQQSHTNSNEQPHEATRRQSESHENHSKHTEAHPEA